MENHEQCANKKGHGLLHKAAIVCLVILGALLIADHWNHVVSALPYLLLLACPLMHLFMHGGHHHSHNKEK